MKANTRYARSGPSEITVNMSPMRARAQVTPIWPVSSMGRRRKRGSSTMEPKATEQTATTPLPMVATRAALVPRPVSMRIIGA